MNFLYKKRIAFTVLTYFSLFISGFIFISEATAQGNLLVTPKRIVFEGNKRSEELNIANTGKDSATYVISCIQLRMTKDGAMEQITEPDAGQQFADKYIRYFPRRVTLAPNEAQTVKIQLINTNELKSGEYRSHLYFRAVPYEKPLGEKEPETNNESISVKLIPIFGLTLPVIIRSGEINAQLQISDVAIEMQNDKPVLKMNLNRTGNTSIYGDINAEYIPASGKAIHIASAKGVAVYTPNTMRTLKMQLEKNAVLDLHKGKIKVTFTEQSGKQQKLAEQELALN